MNDLRMLAAYCVGRMRKLYFMSLPEDRKDLKKSRVLYTVGDSATQAIAQLIGGTFMATLLASVGVRDGNIGIITSMVTLTAIFQLIPMNYIATLKKKKLLVCICVMQKLWYAFVYFIPLLGGTNQEKSSMMIICFVFAHICVQIGTPITIDWIASLVPARLRGRYFAIKDSVAVFVTVSMTLLMGIVLDLTKNTQLKLGFVCVGGSIAILALINMISFSFMKEPKLALLNKQGKELHGHLAKRAKKQELVGKIRLLEEIKLAFRCKNFSKALLLNCMWMTVFYIAAPFNASYQIKELSLPYTYIMGINFATNMLRVIITPKVGKLGDRIGMGKVLRYAMFSMGISYFLAMLMCPANGSFIFPFMSAFMAVAFSFIPIGLLGIQLNFMDREKRTIQFAILSAVSGIYGFCISFLGGKLVNFLQEWELIIYKTPIYAQQVTNFIGLLGIGGMILYLARGIEGVKTTIDKKDGTL